MKLSRVGVAATYPVTIAECKSNLRVQHAADDTLIDSLIAAATDYVSAPNGAINKSLVTESWALTMPSVSGDIDLPITPVQSITTIQYWDTDNVTQTLTVSDFTLTSDEDHATLSPKTGTTWPSTYVRDDAVTITFSTGFGDDGSDVPASIRHAIILIVSHWYENRLAVSDANSKIIPMSAESIIAMNRKGWVA
jgi:uncharacterized phiE125 gp8 family phage protein